MKKILALLLALAMIFALAACGNNTENPETPDTTETTEPTETEPSETPDGPEVPEEDWDGAYIDRDDFRAYTAYDLENVFKMIEGQLEGEVLTAVTAAYETGVKNINAAQTVEKIRAAYADALSAMIQAIPVADGLYSFKKESNDERTKLLGLLEQYAVNAGLTGISLFENGGYTMYNPRITLGTENYIVGYGFGFPEEGTITADLAYETNPDWARYFHTWENSDPGTINYLNDQGSQVGDLYSNIAGSYYYTFMNATKDGYDWVPTLAKEKPVAVNDDDGDGMATTWRFEVRTGETDGLKYTTGSEMESRKAFNDRPVALEDYITPYKLLLTQSNNLFRGSETANSTSGAIAGAKEFYNGTEKGFDEALWENVGVKAYEENGKNYFEVTFADEETQFYAMYYINSSLYQPLPQEFIDLVTVDNLYGFNKTATESPVDNSLSLGAFYLERWDSDQQIVFKKNPNFVFADTKYQIEGIHDKIYPAAESDATAGFQEFLAEHFDSAGIPQDYLDEYRNDPRTHTRTGTSNFKLNVNACDEETWIQLFGENGTVAQTQLSDYWNLKPALGNKHFLHGISLSIDRLSFATARGSIPSVDFLSSNYMSDPENGISYATTQAHEDAVASLLEGTDGNGFNIELARDYFRMALTELEKEGAYTPGTKENPTVIDIEIAWMRPTQEDQYHNEIKNYIETAFNDESVCGGVYQVSVNFWVGNDWSDVYYKKMMLGQYDLGFGSITGNSLDPLAFMNILSSNQSISDSFTLNWGADTNATDVYPLVYNNMRWSYDALYNAGTSQAIVANGQDKATLTFEYNELVKNEDGSYTGSFVITETLPDITTITVTDVVCCNYERYRNGDGEYDEASVEFEATEADGAVTVTFTVPAELAEDYATGSGTSEEPKGTTGFDLYYDMEFNGNASSSYYSVEDVFEIAE